MYKQFLDGFWAKKLNLENVLRFKLRWKIMIPLENRSEKQILLSNLAFLIKIKAKKSVSFCNKKVFI